MELNEDLFTKGFNHGFILAQYEDQLLKMILNKTHEPFNSYMSGLMSGFLQLEMTKLSEKRLEDREIERD